MKSRLKRLLNSYRDFHKQHRRLVDNLKIVLLFGLFFIYGWRTLDPDFGWHLTSGNYFRRYGIPVHDIYTYTARNFPWVDHEWGNDVIVSVLYSLGGYLLTAVVYAVVWTAALALAAGRRTRLVIFLLALLAILPYSGIRPLAWTALALAVLLKLVLSRSRRVLWCIPVLFLVWANLHAGFIIGFVVLAYYAIKLQRLQLLYVLLAAIALSFVNPYGDQLYVEIWRTLSDTQLHHQINEWYPFNLPRLTWLYVALWVAAFWQFSWRRLTNWLSLGPLLLLAALSASRNAPLFVIVSLKQLDGYLDEVQRRIPKKLDFPRKLVLAAMLLILLEAMVQGFYSFYQPLTKSPWSGYPMQAVSYLTAHPCQGNLFNDYDFGGYLIWKLPSEPVFIDGRMPSWKDPSGYKYLDTYFNILGNAKDQKQEFAKYNIQCALLVNDNNDHAIKQRLLKANWRIAVSANGSYLMLAPRK